MGGRGVNTLDTRVRAENRKKHVGGLAGLENAQKSEVFAWSGEI
jgi:hypothetical protein